MNQPNLCPNCEKPAEEIKSGVCPGCLKKITSKHKPKKFDDAPEHLVAFQYNAFESHEHRGMCDGHLASTTDFDWHRLDDDIEDRGQPIVGLVSGASNDRIPELADGLAAILNWCWRTESGAMRDPEHAFKNFVAMSSAINPALLDSMIYREIGVMFQLTKASFSKMSLDFQRAFGIHVRRSRPVSAVRSMALVQRGNHNAHDGVSRRKARENEARMNMATMAGVVGDTPTPV